MIIALVGFLNLSFKLVKCATETTALHEYTFVGMEYNCISVS